MSVCEHSGRQGLTHVNESTLMLTVWDGIRFSSLWDFLYRFLNFGIAEVNLS